METVTISPKFQVVIPRAIRSRLGLRARQKVQAIEYNDRIELIPVRPPRQMRGFLKGIDTTVPRETDRPWWTQDADFEGVAGARYVARRRDKRPG